MKTKTLFYLTFIFGLITPLILIWVLIASSWINVSIFIIVFFLLGWFGMEYANRLRNDPEQFIKDIKSLVTDIMNFFNHGSKD